MGFVGFFVKLVHIPINNVLGALPAFPILGKSRGTDFLQSAAHSDTLRIYRRAIRHWHGFALRCQLRRSSGSMRQGTHFIDLTIDELPKLTLACEPGLPGSDTRLRWSASDSQSVGRAG